jgi:hypothetical protein
MELAARKLRHLPARCSSGLFLENGARLYVDCQKPEITTPEVISPQDACRYMRAGEDILRALADDLVASEKSIAQILLTRSNVSYGKFPATWGFHESYAHCADRSVLARQIIPHFVSRLVVIGAGGFDNHSAGLEFMLSPRVAHLRRAASPESQRDRGIFHTKDESLSNAGHRLHVLCGENVCSHTSLYLRTAATACIVALVEAGLCPGDEVVLVDPLAAMHSFARDVNLSATAATEGGRRLTAVEIQRHYLDYVARFQDAEFMPSWTGECCRLWGDVLDRLARGPEALGATLDWAIKWSLFRRHAEQRGISWEALQEWNGVLARIDKSREEGEAGPADTPDEVARLRPTKGRAGPSARAVDTILGDAGRSRDDLEKVLRVRQELFELDTRFGQIDERGIFATLERAGVLAHHVAGVDNIRQAMTEPPEGTRARLRGKWIKQLAGRGADDWCEWFGVCDSRERRILDLYDPLAHTENWRAGSIDETYRREHEAITSRRMFDDAIREYDAGRYEVAFERLADARRLAQNAPRILQHELLRYAAWTQARRGFLDGPALLDQLAAHRPPDLVAICDYVCVYRFEGLIPSPKIEPWLERGLPHVTDAQSRELGTAATLLGHYAYQLVCENRCPEALEAIERACQPRLFDQTHWRAQARLLAEHGEIMRRLRDGDAAAELLARAANLQQIHGCEADLVDITWTRQAKLDATRNPPRARRLLARVRKIQTENENLQGLARTLLLEARLRAPGRSLFRARRLQAIRKQVLDLREERPALGACLLLARIVGHWKLWTHGEMVADETDYFWRL